MTTSLLPRLVTEDGSEFTLEVDRWMQPIDSVDASVLRRVEGPALDVGCGPGRISAALTELGVPCLGVDVSPWAVHLTRDRGAVALKRSIFERIPGHGRWRTALLFDGNIGIGGDPVLLLQRAASLLHPHGQMLVELETSGGVQTFQVRVSSGGVSGDQFPWAVVGIDGIEALASAAGCLVVEVWQLQGRAFASLTRRSVP